ncbi:2,2-dialkylglycine decarboxylase-like protein [Hapsidospora chrysogenum ATCC 11550]|uniref:2,2-dialkylglycine decarboxylase-like protein n=1 Tax=Hapsidospora chrysogenum (strain ATCC 11550 / CBS 779.69 / DSM 880 / IAM 14645 / JCM 23072 / IMI 49137) TaxID=857340 RepID=A0A086TCE9_HAPC1|nr:2,2-dialkylglycine decarboxylase-like protein [Hapsidospora chrysogenum ATCC 11550]
MAPASTMHADSPDVNTFAKHDAPLSLYQGVCQKDLVAKSKKYLLHFGPEIVRDVIVEARCTYIYTGSGHKVLDWTFGQMSCLLGHGHPEIVRVITAHAIHLDHLFRIYLPSPRLSAMGCHSVLL